MSTTPALPSPLATIFAGETVTVALVNGEVHTVFVRQMPARVLLTQYLLFMEDEANLLERCCQATVGAPTLPEGWVDALTDESHILLVERVHAVNFTRAVAQAERLAARRQALQPLEARAKSLQSSSPTPP